MITVDTLRKCSWLDTISIEKLIRKHYPEDRVFSVEFIGITNGGQFAYNTTYPFEGETHKGRVYVWQDNNGDLVADY